MRIQTYSCSVHTSEHTHTYMHEYAATQLTFVCLSGGVCAIDNELVVGEKSASFSSGSHKCVCYIWNCICLAARAPVRPCKFLSCCFVQQTFCIKSHRFYMLKFSISSFFQPPCFCFPCYFISSCAYIYEIYCVHVLVPVYVPYRILSCFIVACI